MAVPDTYNSQPDAIRIGLLSDMPAAMNLIRLRTAQLVADEYGGKIKGRPIEFRVHEFIGAPTRSTQNAINGYLKLADEGCLIIAGLGHSDNAMVVREHADRRKVPVIQAGASEQLASEYMFSVAWSYMPNESYILANWCKKKGYQRVTVVSDTAWHCQEYLRYFRDACRRWGIEILSEHMLTEFLGEEMRRQASNAVSAQRARNPDATVLLGSSPIAETYAWALHKSGWDVPRCMNADFPRLLWPPEHGILPVEAKADVALHESFNGWVGVSIYDEENQVFAEMEKRYERKFGEPIYLKDPAANYYDMAHAAIEGVANAHLLSPQGVKNGLEQVKQLPAASGASSTIINFGTWDRMSNKGKDGAVLRRIVDGTKGISVL